MLGDDEDVFDSVTWETPTAPVTYEGGSSAPSGPGFRQSTSESEDGRGPHDPKWEGYLITSVKDPVKELAETKDAYVSYLVSAKVRLALCHVLREREAHMGSRRTCPYSLHLILRRGDDSKTLFSCECTWPRISQRVSFRLYRTNTDLVRMLHNNGSGFPNARNIQSMSLETGSALNSWSGDAQSKSLISRCL